jgi:hypothetical protein
MKQTVTDNEILSKCKAILDKWSAGQAYSPTQQLGTDSQFVAAESYTVERFTLTTGMRTRKLHLEQLKNGSDYYSNAKDVDDYDIWSDIKEDDKRSDFDFGIEETTHARTCPQCNGELEVTCSSCDGKGYKKCTKDHVHDHYGNLLKKCPRCQGRGRVNLANSKSMLCPDCDGRGGVECVCHGTLKIECSRCDGRGVVTCPSCEGTGRLVYEWFLTQKYKETKGVSHFKPHDDLSDKFLAYDKLPWESLYDNEVEDDVFIAGVPSDASDTVKQAMKDVGLPEIWSARQKVIEEEAEKFRSEDADAKFAYSFEHASFDQCDSIVRYDYTYDGIAHTAWINLATEGVEEVENGLYASIASDTVKFAEESEKKGNPQDAIYYYCKADAISLKWGKENGTQKKRVKQYRLLGFLFALPIFILALPVFGLALVDCKVDGVGFATTGVSLLLLTACMVSLNEFIQFVGLVIAVGTAIGGKYIFGDAFAADVIGREALMFSLLAYALTVLVFTTDFAQRLPKGRVGLILGGVLGGLVAAPAGLLMAVKQQSFAYSTGMWPLILLLTVVGTVRLPIRLKAGKMQRFVEKNEAKGDKIRKAIERRKPGQAGMVTFLVAIGVMAICSILGMVFAENLDFALGNAHHALVTARTQWGVL